MPPAAAALHAAGFASPLGELLAQRGVDDPVAAARFLAPAADHLTPVHELFGMAAAVERLSRACATAERLLVVGDYDVDGVAATALVAATLGALGARVETLLPRRDGEGYGLQPRHVERAVERGAGVVVAVDSGTAARAAWEQAERRGIDLVVVDHHLPGPDDAPPAAGPGRWLVNPRLAPVPSDASETTAAGLTARLAAALFEAAGRAVPWEALLRLAALGTIADVAPLVGDNRVMTALGLAAMDASPSPGLRELRRLAAATGPLSAADVAFRLAPRLNAAGRLADADAALELLLTRDAERARHLATQLEEWNAERQSLERRILTEARGLLERRGELPWIVVLSSPEWHRGVVGVAAARLARELHRPTILLAEDGDEATGSGRAVAGLPLHELIAPSSGELRRFGGHAQAIGLTVASERVEALRERWEREAEQRWRERLATREMRYDLRLRIAEIAPDWVARLASLAPFGAGNAEPLFRFGPCRVVEPVTLFGRGHLRFAVSDEAVSAPRLPVVVWNGAERWESSLPARVELLAAVEHEPRFGVRLRAADLRGFPAAND